jgi:hypothetical protein
LCAARQEAANESELGGKFIRPGMQDGGCHRVYGDFLFTGKVERMGRFTGTFTFQSFPICFLGSRCLVFGTEVADAAVGFFSGAFVIEGDEACEDFLFKDFGCGVANGESVG